MQRNVEPSAILFQAFTSVIRSFAGGSSQCFCFEARTALVCHWLWVFTEQTWNLTIRSKAAWAKSFLMLLASRKQIIHNQRKTVRRAVTINVCWRKSSCKFFLWQPLTPRKRIAVAVKWCELATASVISFKKERRSSYCYWKISSLQYLAILVARYCPALLISIAFV